MEQQLTFKKAISVFQEAKSKVALGLHLEGPFLNPAKRGAHPEELLKFIIHTW